MRKVYVAGREIALSHKNAIGKGGEADVYNAGNGLAIKIYKSPDHPDLQVPDLAERRTLMQAASERIAVQQRKLPAFPNNLPSSVLGPIELAYDGRAPWSGIAGYTMPYLEGADLLFYYGKRGFREAALASGLTPDRVRDVLLDLHRTVAELHRGGVVIGDFNDLNVLVKDGRAYLVDADSFQYSGFPCLTFQYRFVDPLLCDPSLPQPQLCQPHNQESDWYAYTVMTMQCLLYVDPYGGIYKPTASVRKVPDSARPLHRITVFNPDVNYPRPAIHYSLLPDDLLQCFSDTFERDRRGEFPALLLSSLRWTRCLQCGTEHARALCPNCSHAIPVLVAPPQLHTVRGQVAARLLFETSGRVVAAAVEAGRLLWLYEEHGALRREDDNVVLRGAVLPGMRIALAGRTTYLGKGGQRAVLQQGRSPERRVNESCGQVPLFDANSRHLYWTENGYLYRDGALGPALIGEVPARQTIFWVGEKFGLGYYRAGGMSGAMLFDAERSGINDRVSLPLPAGQIVDSTCVFGQDRCWFLVSAQEGGRIVNSCTLVLRDGRVIASHSAPDGDGSWLGTIHGKCAAGAGLLAPTDEGVMRIEAHGDKLVRTRAFPDTEPFISSDSRLFPGTDGLYVVNSRQIYLLKMV